MYLKTFWYLYKLVLKWIRVEMTIAKQCTGEWNRLFQFLMNKFKPIEIAFIFSILYLWLTTKNRLLISDIHYLWISNNFEVVISLKLIHFHKKLDSQIFTKWIGFNWHTVYEYCVLAIDTKALLSINIMIFLFTKHPPSPPK